MKIPTKFITFIRNNYRPKSYEAEKVEQSELTMYQEPIGEIRQAVEIKILHILHKVSFLLAYQVSPQKTHMEQLIHIFGYLKKRPKTIFNLTHNIQRLIQTPST